MAIFVNEHTKVIVQGLTGGQGKYHGLRNQAYGTQVVGGVTPGKGGTDVAVEGGTAIPVFNTVAEAVAATGATASFIAVPPKAASAAILEAAAAGIAFIVCITEGIPAQDEAKVYNTLVRDYPNTRLLGPNCPGIISPGKCNIGITAGESAANRALIACWVKDWSARAVAAIAPLVPLLQGEAGAALWDQAQAAWQARIAKLGLAPA